MNCLISNKGELLEILQASREPLEGQQIVPLDGYYELFNLEHYNTAVWDFELKKWKGVGEPNIIPEPQPSEMDLVKTKLESQDKVIEELMFSIIPEITGGGI